MMDGLETANFVLVVCTETYYRRFRGHESPGKGKGASWEGALITQAIYDDRRQSIKFIPIFLGEVDDRLIPDPLRSATYYSLTTEDQYKSLYAYLTGQIVVTPSPIGAIKRINERHVAPISFDKTTHDPVRKNDVNTESVYPLPPNPFFAHSYTLLDVDEFIGRSEELAALSRWSTLDEIQSDSPPILIVNGIGGAGKSALCWHWFQNASKKAWDGAIWWSFYEQNSHFENFIINALAYLRHEPIRVIQKLAPEERLSNLTDILSQNSILIVLDGFERALEAYGPSDAHYLDYNCDVDSEPNKTVRLCASTRLTSGRFCLQPSNSAFLKTIRAIRTSKFLITTRLIPAELEQMTGDLVPGCALMNLNSLSDSDALSLWRRYKVSGDDQSLLDCFRTFKNHPLLIKSLAGAVAHYRPAPRDFDQWRKDHPSFNPFELPLEQVRSHVLSVALNGLDQASKSLLMHIAAFRMPVKFTTLHALMVGERRPFKSINELNETIDALQNRGLVGWDEKSTSFDLHPIVRGVAWLILDSLQKEEICNKIYLFFDGNDSSSRRVKDVTSIDDLNFPIEMINILIRQEKLDEAAAIWQNRVSHCGSDSTVQAPQFFVDLLQPFFPNNSVDECRILDPELRSSVASDLGTELRKLGRYSEALPLFLMRQDQCGCTACHSRTAQAYWELGQLYNAEWVLRESLFATTKGKQRKTAGSLSVFLDLLSIWLDRGVKLEVMRDYLDVISPAINLIKESLPKSDSCNSLSVVVNYFWVSAFVAAKQKLIDKALEDLSTLKAILVDKDDPFSLAQIGLIEGKVYLATENHSVALDVFIEAEKNSRKIGFRLCQADALRGIAFAKKRNGELISVKNELNELVGFANTRKLALFKADAHRLLAELAIQEDDENGASVHAELAYRSAWCDGPPFHYSEALLTAKNLMLSLETQPPVLPHTHNAQKPLPDFDPLEFYGE